MAESVELPSWLGILPVRNRVLLPSATFPIRCTSASSVKLVEQELLQGKEKRLIGIVPVRDAAEMASVGSMLFPGAASDSGERVSEVQVGTSDGHEGDGKNQSEVIHWHNRGVAARALRVSSVAEKPSGRVIYTVVLEGLCRFNVQELSTRGTYYTARVTSLEMTKAEMELVEQDSDFLTQSHQFKAGAAELISILEQKEKASGQIKDLLPTVPILKLADIFVATFETCFEELLSMLNCDDLKIRLSKAAELVECQLALRVREDELDCAYYNEMRKLVHDDLAALEREWISAGMSSDDWNSYETVAIKKELGDGVDHDAAVAALERKIQSAVMPSNVWKRARWALRRLKRVQPWEARFEYTRSRVYLELLADLPWKKASKSHELDLKATKERLDSDHYGLSRVKQRIIEYLAFRKLEPDARGPILCFVGPSGVGKTSLASSIAAALGRKFVCISFDDVKEEADIRGYTGIMPGCLIAGLKRVGVCNPVMLLDEIDKTCFDVRGDLASALLEVLDPAQNKSFNDHYLNVPFDLSKVIFVATANEAHPIPPPLLDRMEVIELPGYTFEEKLKIAVKHLIPRVLEENGLGPEFLQIPEVIVRLVIQRYTREAGVGNLERHLAALVRAATVKVVEQEETAPPGKDVQRFVLPLLENRIANGAETDMEVIPRGIDNHETSNTFRMAMPLVVDESMLEEVLGPPRFVGNEALECVRCPGSSVGLVLTSFGGDVQFVVATTLAGKGELHLTSQLGDVFKDSAQIALSWVRARASDLQLVATDKINLIEGKDILVHFPAGAVCNDVPSACVTLVTALVSLFSRRRVRADTAMTGEMTLRGRVLPVGGIKDKVLAARRHGIKRVILPERNLKDLDKMPATVLDSLEVLLAERMEDVLDHAFEGGWSWRHDSTLSQPLP